MADVIARMKVDTKEYDAGLSKATKRLNDFTKQNTSLNGIMAQGMTTLTKLAGGFAAVELAVKTFNATIMEGSQTTGDFVRNGIGALNDTMGQLAKSIVTFDWTPFENGILNVYRDAVSLRRELDNLWNEQVARGTMSAKTQYTVQSARSTLSDANATPEQRKAAQKALDDALADIREANETYTKHLQKVIAQEGEFGSAATNLTFKNVENIYETVAKRGQEEAKAIYQPFHDELKEMQRQLKELEGMDRKATRVGVYDTGGHSAERKQLKQMIDGYREYYKEELAGWDILERNDNAYQDLANHVNDYYNALSEVEGLQRRANVTSNRLGAAGGTGTRSKSTPKAAEPITSNINIQDFAPIDLSRTIFEPTRAATDELDKMSKAASDTQKKVMDAVRETVSGLSGITEVAWEDVEKAALSNAMNDAEKIKAEYEKVMRMRPEMPSTSLNELGEPAVVAEAIEEHNKALKEWEENNRQIITQYGLLQRASDGRYGSLLDETRACMEQKAAISQMGGAWNGVNKAQGKAVLSMEELQSLAKFWNKQMSETTTQDQFLAAENALKKVQRDMELQPIALRAGISIAEAEQQEKLQAQLDEMRLQMQVDVEMNNESLVKAANSGKDAEKDWQAAARAISSAGSALQGIDDKGLNVAGTIMEAIANVALAFSAALKSPATTAAGIFGWIAAAAAGTATMVATIATIKSATSGSYAQGGIVPGKYNGGLDNTYVYASPGEVILNRAQQENLLSQLEPATSSGTSYVSGEQLITVINNTGRRRGKGELIFG